MGCAQLKIVYETSSYLRNEFDSDVKSSSLGRLVFLQDRKPSLLDFSVKNCLRL